MVAHKWATMRLCSVAVTCTVLATVGGADKSADYIARGAQFLAAGDFSGALDQYHTACDVEPDNYLNFYKRATVYLATGRTRQAMTDLVMVLKLRPDFNQARERLAELRVKDGSYAQAKLDYQAMPKYAKSEPQLAAIAKAEDALKSAREPDVDPSVAIELYTQAIEVSPQFVQLRLARAKVFEAVGRFGDAVGDVSRAVKLKSGNVEGYFWLSRLHFQTGDREESLKQIREAVKLDGDNKPAFTFYKMLKKFNKAMNKVQSNIEGNRHAESIQNMEKARGLDTEKTFVYQDELNLKMCQAYQKLSRTEEAFGACNATLELNPRSLEALVVRADLWETIPDFEAQIADLKEADEMEENNQRVKEKLQRAEKLLKQSLKRDYYKILGLPRDCNKKQISKAYRNLAMIHHPDKFPGEEEKKAAEVKFMDIAAAKEVLSDPEKRKMFDDGEDPLDAEQERERNQGGFNPFGGGQRFHFRHG